MTPTSTYWYNAGDRIGLGDLIAAYIDLHTTPEFLRREGWHQQEKLIRATLNQITEEVADQPGTIWRIPLRPPIQPTDKL